MWVYRRPPQHPRVLRAPFYALTAGETRALAEVACNVSAAGVVLGVAHASVTALADTGNPLKTGSASTSVALTATAFGRDASGPGAVFTVSVSVTAVGRGGVPAVSTVVASFSAGNGDVLSEPCTASVAVTASALAGQTRAANCSVVIAVAAVGFSLAPDTDGDALASVAVDVVAAGVVPALATASVAITSEASEGTTIGFPGEMSVRVDAQATAIFLGPASAFGSTSVEVAVSATGRRISGAEIGNRTPAGRSIDWRALVEGAHTEVPDYEFGHKPVKRKFFQ